VKVKERRGELLWAVLGRYRGKGCGVSFVLWKSNEALPAARNKLSITGKINISTDTCREGGKNDVCVSVNVMSTNTKEKNISPK
jgi:hypothetical protein